MATSLSSATWSPRQWFTMSPRPPAPCPTILATSYRAVSTAWRLPPGPPTSKRRPALASGQVGPTPGKAPGDSRLGVGGGPEPRANVTGLLAPVRGWCQVPGWAPSPARFYPAHPPLAPVPPGQLALRALGTRALRASWYSSGGAAWLHLLLTDLLSGFNLTAGVTRGVSSHTFPCLSPGTPYTLKLSAVAGPHWAVGPRATEWTRECWGFAGHCRGPSAKRADPAMRGASRVLQGRGEARGCPPAGWW